MKSPQDPAGRASETPPVSRKMSRRDVVEHATPHAQPVGDVLDTLQAQAKDAIPDVFTDGSTAAKAPLMKRMRSEIGSTEVNAAVPDADLRTRIEMEVRCDRNGDDDGGSYQVRAEGYVARGDMVADVPLAVSVDEDDGGLRLDTAAVRDDISKAVRATEQDAPEKP